MGETTIEWTATFLPDGSILPGFSFNPWVGCQKISPACDHCYAEGWAKRTGNAALWSGERRRTSESNWRQPLKWNREARTSGIRRKVFCASLADVFDNQVPEEWRTDLFNMIWNTQNLDWLLLTKRPQNILKMIEASSFCGLPTNVWLGTTVENSDEASKRIPHLLSIPAAVHFLSCEPLLGPVHLPAPDAYWHSLDWVIAGGESGHGSRPPMIGWVRSLRDQCAAHSYAFHFKQWGEFTPEDPEASHTSMVRVGKKKAGALLDGQEWRQFPSVGRT